MDEIVTCLYYFEVRFDRTDVSTYEKEYIKVSKELGRLGTYEEVRGKYFPQLAQATACVGKGKQHPMKPLGRTGQRYVHKITCNSFTTNRFLSYFSLTRLSHARPDTFIA